jgi:hypothetical protein
MQTFTGRAFYPLDPRPDDVDPVDIAHALSLICRFGGHSKHFYSVAEHCVLMAQWVEKVSTREDALWALLHDATEAYVGDMVRPLKRSMPDYRETEDRLMDVICYKFGLSMDCPSIVHEADNRILVNERAAFMSTAPLPWVAIEQLDPLPQIYPAGWDPRFAEITYLDTFYRLSS